MTIRPATANDAKAIGKLAEQFNRYLRHLGDTVEFHLTVETILQDGFGDNPAFAGLVAEQHDVIVGYLLYHFGYDTDLAIRLLHVIDLYVDEDIRRQGVGKELMTVAAKICREAGGKQLFWSVFVQNKLAAFFYEMLGARYISDLRFMIIDANSL